MRKPGFLFVITALLFAFAANGAMAEIKEGKDYAVLTQPQPIDTKGKVEVIEFSGTAVRIAMTSNRYWASG